LQTTYSKSVPPIACFLAVLVQREVSTKVLPREQRGDIRDVISIGKLVTKNDGPEEVEQILSTMTKYGEMKEY
jgi:hypothetical protein